MISPATLKLAAAVIYSAALFLAGWTVNGWRHDAEDVREARIVAKAQEGAAKAIAEMEVKNVTIRQQLQTEIRKEPIYVGCLHTPDGLRLVNAALLGPRSGELPGAGSAD